MRGYLDIIEDLKDGLKPDYEEIRLACLMANYMLWFSEEGIKRLTGYGKGEKQKDDLISRLEIKSYEDRFYDRQKSPEQYLGNWHPDAPGRQEERKRHQKIFDGIMKKIEDHDAVKEKGAEE